MRKLYATIILMLCVFRMFAGAPLPSPARQAGFVENKGQFRDQHGNPNPDVLYMADFGGMKVQLRKDGFSYEVYQVKPRWVDPATIPYKIVTYLDNGDSMVSWPGKQEAEKKLMYHFQRINISLEGCNLSGTIDPELPESLKDRWLLGKSDSKMIEAGRFRRVNYHDIYPGIDLVCYSNPNGGGFKYDFVLHPGADASVIRLHYAGADHLSLSSKGDLEINTEFGVLIENTPQCYLESDSADRIPIIGIHFTLTDNLLMFGGVEPVKQKLVIDPAVNIVWGTYYGDFGGESLHAMAADPDGFTYACGNTSSAMNIATSSTYLDSLLLPVDGFLCKMTPQGQRSWGTYLGGFSAADIALCSGSDIVINGENGIAKFDSTGNLTWIVYENNCQTAIAVNRQDEIIAIGDSVVKLSPNGLDLWKIRFGGHQTTLIDLTTDTTGNIIITGLTRDTTGIATPGCHQPVYGGGSYKWGGYHNGYATDSYGDAFLAKLSPDADVLWSTYYGGSDFDEGTSVTVNNEGKIVMGGLTNSLNGISAAGSYQNQLTPNGPISFIIFGINFTWPCPDPGNMWNFLDTCLYGPYTPKPFDSRYQDQDCFLAWFDQDGHRISSTYYGDSYREYSPKVSCMNEKVYFGSTGFRRYNTGTKLASDFPFLDHTGPGINNEYIFLTCFDSLSHRLWGTYYGDIQDINSMFYAHDGNLFLSDICQLPQNKFIISGKCRNTEGITTTGTYKSSKGYDLEWDGFITKFACTDALIEPVGHRAVCPGDSVTITYFDGQNPDTALNYQWFKDNNPIPEGIYATLLIYPVNNTNQGYYNCKITAGDFNYSLPLFKVTVTDTIEFDLLQSGLNNIRPLLGDLNGDEYLDIIGTNIYLNQDSLYSSCVYVLPEMPERLADLDNNDSIDIISANKIFLNHSGIFQSVGIPEHITSWTDIDHDGDLDGIFYGSDAYSGKIYAWKNDELIFTLKTYQVINAPWGPIACKHGSLAADFNHDGETDMVVFGSGSEGCSSGNYCFYLERQGDEFLFHNNGTMGIIRHLSIETSDYNSDGYLDLLLTGYENESVENNLLVILAYDSGAFIPVFTDTLPGSAFNYSTCPAKWMDLDNDGDPDIIHGKDLIMNNSGAFQKISSACDHLIYTGLPSAPGNAGDSDNDGYPEIVSGSALFEEISCNPPNTPPTAPFNLQATTSADTVRFSWNPATDAQTPSLGLSYNLRVGTTPGGCQVMSPMSNPSGFRQVVELGNCQQNLGWWLHGLLPGTYYWSVQAIDNSYAGGPFAPEQIFTILPPVPVNNNLAGDTVSNGESLCFDASSTITVGGAEGAFRVSPGGMVTLIAGQKIRLLPETSVSENGYLHGYITGNNEYCFSINQPIVASKVAAASAESPGLSGKEFGSWSVAVYPNPVSDLLNVRINSDFPQEPVKLEMYNLLGSRILEKTTTFSPEMKLNVSTLSPGIYLLSVEQGNQRAVVKVIRSSSHP